MENHIEVEEAKQNKGFTLVELLIVIVILGILATVTVFAVTGITNKGKTSACQADAKTLEKAEGTYSANRGSYTNNQQLLVDEGALHSTSKKLTVQLMPAGTAAVTTAVVGTATVVPVPVHPAVVVDSFYLAGIWGTDCAGMTF